MQPGGQQGWGRPPRVAVDGRQRAQSGGHGGCPPNGSGIVHLGLAVDGWQQVQGCSQSLRGLVLDVVHKAQHKAEGRLCRLDGLGRGVDHPDGFHRQIDRLLFQLDSSEDLQQVQCTCHQAPAGDAQDRWFLIACPPQRVVIVVLTTRYKACALL